MSTLPSRNAGEYIAPSHPDYKTSRFMFFNRYYCSVTEAERNDLREYLDPSDYQKAKQESERKSLVTNSPVDFPVYTPANLPEGILKDKIKTVDGLSGTGHTTSQDLGINGYQHGYGYITQGRINSSEDKRYWVCNNEKAPCHELGKTSEGLTVYTAYYAGGNSTVWGIRKNTTYIIILVYGMQKPTGINNRTVLSVFNSLQQIN